MSRRTVRVRDLLSLLTANNMDVEYKGEDSWLDKPLSYPDIHSPSVALANFWEHFPRKAILFFSKQELAYVCAMNSEQRDEVFMRFVEFGIEAVFLERFPGSGEALELFCKTHEIPVFVCQLSYLDIFRSFVDLIDLLFADETTLHGVLIDIAEMGVLIIGKSGIGKSECALELIRRGYRLVADDVVFVKKKNKELFGFSSSFMRHYLEIRGVGIINIKDFYGLSAVSEHKKIDMVVNLVMFDKQRHVERLGLDREQYRILGVEVPMYTIPITPGKNICTIIEVVAKNEFAKKLGYDAPMKLTNQLLSRIKEKSADNDKNK